MVTAIHSTGYERQHASVDDALSELRTVEGCNRVRLDDGRVILVAGRMQQELMELYGICAVLEARINEIVRPSPFPLSLFKRLSACFDKPNGGEK